MEPELLVDDVTRARFKLGYRRLGVIAISVEKSKKSRTRLGFGSNLTLESVFAPNHTPRPASMGPDTPETMGLNATHPNMAFSTRAGLGHQTGTKPPHLLGQKRSPPSPMDPNRWPKWLFGSSGHFGFGGCLEPMYLDLANKQRTLSDGTVQTLRYSVSSLGALSLVSAPVVGGCGGNCFGALPTSVRVEDHHNGFSRTMVEFTTGCMSLTPDQSVVATNDAFSTCARCPNDSTNFDFDMRLTECTESSGKIRCTLRDDARSVTVAMNHVEEPETVQWAIDNQQQVGFQVDFRHEREYDEAGLDEDGVARNTTIGPGDNEYYYEKQEEIDTWRDRATLGRDPLIN